MAKNSKKQAVTTSTDSKVIKYLKSAKRNDKGELIAVYGELAIPSNIVDIIRFVMLFTAVLENRILCNLAYDISKCEDDTLKAEKTAIYAFLADNYNSEALKYYNVEVAKCKDNADIKADFTFIKWLADCALGFEKGTKGNFGESCNALVLAVKPVLNYLVENKTITDKHAKDCKEAFNLFANNRLATTNNSGLFKNYHVEFKTCDIMHILLCLETRYKWDKKGFNKAEINPNILGFEILRTALKRTFRFDCEEVKKVDIFGTLEVKKL